MPAGGALAVDRYAFSDAVTEKIRSHPNITVIEDEVTEIPAEGNVLIASGPLTSDALAEHIAGRFPEQDYLHFFDAAAPLVTFESIDMDKAWFASRYDKGTAGLHQLPHDHGGVRCLLAGAVSPPRRRQLHGFEDQRRVRGLYARRGHGVAGGTTPSATAP